MNSSEFVQWLRYHSASFQGMATMLKTEGSQEEIEQRASRAEAWQHAFRDVSLVDAKAGTDAMVSGEIPEPHGYDRHAQAICNWVRMQTFNSYMRRSRAKSSRPVVIDGEVASTCPLCWDTGLIRVVHPRTARELKRDPDTWTAAHVRLCNVACTCEHGNRWSLNDVFSQLPVYDESRMIRYDGPYPFAADALNDEQKELIGSIRQRVLSRY